MNKLHAETIINKVKQDIKNMLLEQKMEFWEEFAYILPYPVSFILRDEKGYPTKVFDVVDPYYGSTEFYSQMKYFYLYNLYELEKIPYYQITIDDWNSRTQRYYKEIITGINENRANFPKNVKLEMLTKNEFWEYARLFSHKHPNKCIDRHHDNYYAIKDIDGNFLFGFCYKSYNDQIYNLMLNPDYNDNQIYNILNEYYGYKSYSIIIERGLEEHIFRNLLKHFHHKSTLCPINYNYDYDLYHDNEQYEILNEADYRVKYSLPNSGFISFYVK